MNKIFTILCSTVVKEKHIHAVGFGTPLYATVLVQPTTFTSCTVPPSTIHSVTQHVPLKVLI